MFMFANYHVYLILFFFTILKHRNFQKKIANRRSLHIFCSDVTYNILIYVRAHVCTCVYVFVYVYACVCVCVCVC